MLSSPIILYDHPEVAPESQGDLFDATEIDEILALRVLTLTDDEKDEARRTDARAAAIVDRIDAMSPEVWARLHGAMRPLRRSVARRADDVAVVGPGGRRVVRPVHRRRSSSRARVVRAGTRCGCTRTGVPTRTTCSSPG